MCQRTCYSGRFRVVIAIMLSWSYTCQETSLEGPFHQVWFFQGNSKLRSFLEQFVTKFSDFLVAFNSWQILNLYYNNFEDMVPIHGVFKNSECSCSSREQSTMWGNFVTLSPRRRNQPQISD